MINDRNTRPRWSNVNRHPHSAGGTGNPYMATLWQWRMLRLSRACLASTSHLSYLSELSFQSIRQADIWMVFNILVGTVCKGGEGSMNMCVCVSVCVWERGGGWDGESENETVWERGVGPLWAFYVFVCVWCWGMGGCLMKSWVNADTAHAHTHTHTHTHTHKNSHTQTHTHTQPFGTVERACRYWSQPLFRLSTESESEGGISPIPLRCYSPSPCQNLPTQPTNLIISHPCFEIFVLISLFSSLQVHHI